MAKACVTKAAKDDLENADDYGIPLHDGIEDKILTAPIP